MMSKKNKILIQIKKSIIKEDAFAEVILFGSRARGDNTIVSDWDILILTNQKNTNELEDKFRNNLYDIELETGQIISTLVYSKEYWENYLKFTPLYNKVNKEGISL